MKTLILIIIFGLIGIALGAAFASEPVRSEDNELDEPLFPEAFRALMFGTDFRNASRRGRQMDETDEEGRIIPGAPSFLTRFALKRMLFKILRAFVQYFADIFVADIFT
ncbi:hypothetical protein CDAR_173701 [Caerostris darwini]|uniref:Uncharacterized protein n=1 Tax=Caerostris darwini TaxID=1538125 RepID=A0AAV4WHW6_9ARAC|nr:uncharacterized protein CDAR_173611 [Caerostris darwini]GIY82347.1 hypothetical protein CDAR_173701 [Caerostris darwini]